MLNNPNRLSFSEEQLQSLVISFLRFPLCVGVVMIHIVINTKDCPLHPLYDSINYFFAQILARVAVPMFFMFSGFLFFYRTDSFTFGVYKEKIKKRILTLFVPYVFWNLMVAISLLFICKSEPSYSLIDWLKSLWNAATPPPAFAGEGIASYPISNQFWYIRDLMVTILFSPIIYLFTKKTFYFVFLLGILWITGCWFLVTGINLTALFFFSLGAYFSINKRNFISIVKPYTILLGIMYLLFSIPVFITKDLGWTPLRRVGILLGIAFTISLTARYIADNKWRVNKFLSESSFFIFAYHILALTISRTIVSFSFSTDLMCTILYFVELVVVIVGGLFLYYFLRRCFPKFTAVITGGR